MKRVLRMTSLALVLTMLMSVSAMAVTLGPGFYGFSSSSTQNGLTVKIEAQDANGTKISAQTAELSADKTAPYYEGAVKLSVTCTVAGAAADDQFLVLLMDDNGTEIPLATDTIYYIDQTAGTVNFNVYPMLPDKETHMMLYITSNKAGFQTVKIPVSYTPVSKYDVAPYKLGDVNENGEVDVGDAVMVLEHVVEKRVLTGNPALAADVTRQNGIDVGDAVRILEYVVEKITSFD